MRRNPFISTFLLPALLLCASCQKEARTETADESLSPTFETAMLTKAAKASKPGDAAAKKLENELLKSVRTATARFHSTTQAIKADYEPDEHCVSVPGLGGMGYHWVNRSFVDPVFDPLKPEALLYATGPGGKLKLVGVEYIVVKTPNQPTPQFGNRLFDDGGTPLPIPHWTLHVWLYEHNPSGMYAPFNPNISCP